ncbi:MAG TPA: NosD domain-containing protein [Gemmatimonadales bacterium]|nr:NosD domain-containing protein [Gemmatimonadales bacterium]
MCVTASLALLTLGLGCGPSHPAGRQQVGTAPRTGHYVAPKGTPAGNGSVQRPWDLQFALSGARGRVHAGDTVWLRGGTYHGEFRTSLDGAAGRWIVFRQYPGERATIDGTLRADGSYLAFWGFEVMQSVPDTYGIQANTAHGKFINLIVHDAGTQGVSFWTPAVDAELYGCIIYNNGTHDNFDHGTYVHNEDGTKLITDNVFFNNLARGIQIYASPKNPVLRNITVEGNVSFDNGTISNVVAARENLIFNAPVPTEGMVGIANMLYFAGDEGINLRVGKYAPQNNRDIVLRNNYAAGGKIGLEMIEPWIKATVTGNTFIGSRDVVKVGGASLPGHYQWSDNTWVRDPGAKAWRDEDKAYEWDDWKRASGLGSRDAVLPEPPKASKVFVRPNRYEPGRAHIIVYNWAGGPSVAVDVSGVLKPGDRYEVRNVQSVFGAPVASGVYQGGMIAVPMTGVTPPAPIGRVTRTPPKTAPEFDVFLLTSPSR